MKRRDNPEERLHKTCVEFLQVAAPPDLWWTHPHNEGKRSKADACRAKAMGQRAGTPDLLLLWRGRLIGVELKAPKGRVSTVQEDCHEAITRAGGQVVVARSLHDLYAVLTERGVPLRARPV